MGVLVIGLALTLLFMLFKHREQQEFLAFRFNSYVDNRTDLIQQRILSYEHGLRGTRSAILATGIEAMTLDRFKMISRSRDPESEFPGIRGFGFIERVRAGGDEAFLEEVARQGRRDFKIKQLKPYEGERFVIKYIEPEANNRQAVGLDIGSEANRREAILEAMRTGTATLTHPITLVQADGKIGRGFLLLLPYYPDAVVPADPAAREAAALGATYAPLVIDEVLSRVTPLSEGVALTLSDVDSQGQPTVFYDKSEQKSVPDGLVAQRRIEVFGRHWLAEYRALPKFMNSLPSTRLIEIGGLGALISLLLAWLTYQDRRSRAMLGDSEERLNLFIAHAPAALAMFDRDMRYLAVSQRWCGDYGLSQARIMGRSHYEIFPEIPERWREYHRRALAGEVISAERDEFRRSDGSVIWLKWEILPWTTVDGQIGGIVVFSEDITRAVAAEEEVRSLNTTLEAQVEERTHELETARRSLQSVLDAVPSLIGYWDKDQINRVANHAYLEWFGMAPEQLHGKSLRELLGESMYEANLPYIEAVLAGEAQTFERTIPRPDGQGVRYSLAHYLPDFVDGEVKGFLAVVHDITELTVSREQLAALVRENDALLRSIDRQLIYSVTDTEGRIQHVNDKFCQVSGFKRDELIGKDHRILRSGLHTREFWREMWTEVMAGHAWRGDVCDRTKDGRLVWLDSVIAPLVDQDGKVEQIVALRYDITLSKQAMLALEEAKQEAERANQAKSTFLANTSHEIRTPLNAVIGMAYLLEQTRLSEDQKEQVAAIQSASRALLDLINDVLDLAKIEAGEMVYENRPFMLSNTLEATRRLFQAQAERKGLELEIAAVPEGIPDVLLGDELRLRQIFNNLISNAIKFTVQGRVGLTVAPIEVAREEAVAGVQWLRFEIEDTGEGIPPEAAGQLFTPFMQVDGSITRRHGGTGLGLSIVRQLAEGMGGRVGMESVLGAGSRFWLELPFGLSPSKRTAVDEHRQHRSLEVLIVDDEPYQCEILLGMASQLGWNAEVVASGMEMIERALVRQREGKPYDCLIVDWRMPQMNGVDALKQLREKLGDALLPAVIMTTIHDIDELRSQGADTLSDKILTKPINPSTLFNQVNESVVSHGLGYGHVLTATAISDGHSRWLPGVRVLVVDDSDLNLDVCSRILVRQGAQVSVCSDGKEAVDKLAVSGGEFDLVLMDLQMPVMDGFTATHKIRNELGLKRLPVVALTAGALTIHIEQALSEGMNEVLTKPLNPEDLIRTIRLQVEAARGSLLPVERLLDLPEIRATVPGVESFPEIEGIDRQQAYRRLQGDVEFLHLLLSRFVEDYGDEPSKLVAMLRYGQPTSAAAQLHKLRGIAANFGAVHYADVAKALEASLLEIGGDTERALSAYETAHVGLLASVRAWLETQQSDRAYSTQVVREADRHALVLKLAELDGMLAANLFSAGALSEEIEGLVDRTELAQEYHAIAKAVRNLRYAVAREALMQFQAEHGLNLEEKA